ncbi:MAG: phage tail family protein [Oscillospiraceae bacterium]|nr:phage tail family protein [Oscillospiraceae bacterium]
MSYLILNGKKSTLVRGLLIQALPPIVKPMIRAEIEEIDGRDGDIVTPLGYAAYDRKVRIGLHGCFDIAEVAAYFNSSGTVVFSDEIDHYYRYVILQQIDFERLIRFRVADVVFHVQPFKYSTIEGEREYELRSHPLNLQVYQNTSRGVTATCDGEEIVLSGTATTPAEFIVPATPARLTPDAYTVAWEATGDVYAALISGTVAQKVGGLVHLTRNQTAIVTVPIETQVTGIYLYAAAGSVDAHLRVTIVSNRNAVAIRNNGNVAARPKLTITGTGTVLLAANNASMRMDFGETESTITVDAERMEAYTGSTLMNRRVYGDYEAFVLAPGENVLSWTGTVRRIVASRYSRWI